MFHTVEIDLGGRKITLETGKMAKQANGAVVVRSGDSVVLVTACMADEPKPGAGFFPLTVDYREYTYAAGKIPGGFIKREGRPSEKEVLTSRLIDRPIRPLFPEGFLHETQIIAMVLSADPEQDPNSLAIVGAAAALAISDIPFPHVLGGVRVGMKDGQYVANPTYDRRPRIQAEHRGGRHRRRHRDGGSRRAAGLRRGSAGRHRVRPRVLQEDRRRHSRTGEAGGQAQARVHAAGARPGALRRRSRTDVREELTDALNTQKYRRSWKATRGWRTLKKRVLEAQPEEQQDEAGKCFDALKERIFRDEMLKNHRRPDGRAFDEIRPITIETGVLPRTHGSALFTRGETQALVTVTLGTKDDEQRIELLEPGEASKRFMLHYNFPPFSVGEVGFMRGPGRREIGHGALAERALDGADSRRTRLPLHHARGQRHPGIQRFELAGHGLRRIAGADGCRRAAGRARGRRRHGAGDGRQGLRHPHRYRRRRRSLRRHGFQGGRHARGHHRRCRWISRSRNVTTAIMKEALEQARRGRLFILDKMYEAHAGKPSTAISQYAPRIYTLHIPTDKIRDVIGPGGKVIRGIIEQTGVKIDVEDDGTVHVASADEASANKAIQIIADLTATAEVGKTYLGKVVRLVDFGAFVEIFPGTDGLLHISEIAENRISEVRDELKEGDQILVKVLALEGNKIKLSRKAVLKEQREKLKHPKQ